MKFNVVLTIIIILLLVFIAFIFSSTRKSLGVMISIKKDVEAIHALHEKNIEINKNKNAKKEDNNELINTTNRMVAEMHEFCFVETIE